MRLFDLTDKNCLITGGAGLLGKYHAEAIIEAGGNVFLADILETEVLRVARLLRKKYGVNNVAGFGMDVTDSDSVMSVCDKIPRIDILINNAAKDPKVRHAGLTGGKGLSRFEMMSLKTWKEGLDVALNGTFLVTQIVINKMLENVDPAGGVVLNISSDLSVIAPDQRIYQKDNEAFSEQNVKPIFYSASKWAIVGMTKYLATYFAKQNIRVNSMSPGGVFHDHPEDFVDKLTNLIPMARMANIDEYKGAVVFSCSSASSYMTGHNLVLDGGRSLW